MNKMLVVVFDTESSAYKGLEALKSLHKDSSISLYSSGILAKDLEGKVELKQADDKGPIGTAIGMATGSLIGLMLGPAGAAAGVAAGAALGGAAVGASLGGLTGMLVDLDESGVDVGFLEEVSKALKPGKSALLAEVDEMWETPVDTRMAEEGGLVFRRLRSEVADEQYLREAQAFSKQLDDLEAELAEASNEADAALNKKIDDTKSKLQTIHEQARDKWEQTIAEADAKTAAMGDQLVNASDKQKEKLEKRIDELNADYDQRAKKLEKATQMTKEALS